MSDTHHTEEYFQNFDEQKMFEVLDRYVDFLHQDDSTSRSQLLVKNPDLKKILGCLESLESIATQHLPKPKSDEKSQDESLHETGSMIFEKYELKEEIGRGGMGVVYRAHQEDLDREVAVKMILGHRFASEDDLQRFAIEAKAAGKIRHPNIVGIHEFGEWQGQQFFAMDYIDGQSLAEIVKENGALPPEDATTLMISIANAVQYLHERQVIHRDLKPSNILIDDDGTPFITDFGLAKILEGDSTQTMSGTIIGTPSYMPPEQASGKKTDPTPENDVYSLGAVFYEMLTGRPPFKKDSPLDTLVDVIEGEATLLTRLNSKIPRELEIICLKCLEKNPEARYPTAKDVADDLERYLKKEPTLARPKNPWQKLRRWARREPALVSRWSILLAAVLIATLVWLIHEIEGISHQMRIYHIKIVGILGFWMLVAFVFQKLLNRKRTEDFARYGWALCDATLLTAVLSVANGPIGPLLIGYPVCLVSAGLFFRVRLIVFMTVISVLSYGILLWIRSRVHPGEFFDPTTSHYPIIFAAVLILLGFVVGYQVYRVRALSRYYENRR